MAQDKPAGPDWIAIQGDYLAGQRTLRDIASQHGITEGAIRKRAKHGRWVRNAPQTKRAMVAAHMAGASGGRRGTQNDVPSTQSVLDRIEDAAADDIADLERGLRVQRHCLMALEQAAETATDPREVKVIVEAAGNAVDSIRRIRGLADEDRGKSGAAPDDDDDARATEIATRLAAKLTGRAPGGTAAQSKAGLALGPVGA